MRRGIIFYYVTMAYLVFPPRAFGQELEHLAPEPPQLAMGDMPHRSMVTMMQMDDAASIGRVVLNRFEWRNIDSADAASWDAKAWYGGDYSKALLKTEGKYASNTSEDARAELLWDRIFARWWSAQVGLRQDFGGGPSRNWVAAGVEGLAPYWFDVEATIYIGDAGRTAVRFDVEYDLRITQRLILRSEIESNLYGKPDAERQLGSGLSDIEIGLRLRYEFCREFAPYVGLAWRKQFGGTADYAQAAGSDVSGVQAIAGFRIWF